MAGQPVSGRGLRWFCSAPQRWEPLSRFSSRLGWSAL